VPLYDLLKAEIAVFRKKGGGFAFQPVVDGKVFPRQLFEPTAPEASNDVPLILSSVLDEAALALSNFNLDDAGLVAIVNKRYGADGPKILETFKRTYPNTTPYLLQARIFSQFDHRARVLRVADRKSAAGGAPCWVYRFDFPSPAYGGKFGTVHGIDTSLVFHNNLSDIAASPPPELLRLTDQLAATWTAFARTGNPTNPQVPAWPAYDSTKRTTMLFDRMARAAEDPDRDLRVLVTSIPTRE
jgi:para-nitrobenzyl esterase